MDFIADTIKSVIIQSYTNWELIIVDDCSTDKTDEVVKPFLTDKRILYIKNEANSGAAVSRNRALKKAKGKWIAFLDSDDLWAPDKLEKQVDFMEKHPDYSVCWHRCTYFSINSSIIVEDNCDKILKDKEGVDITLEDFFNGWYTQPLTTLLRRSAYDSQWYKQYQYYRDEHEFYHLLKRGKGYLFAFVGGVYVKHNGGIYTSMSENSRREVGLKVARELYNVNKDAYTYHFYCQTLQWLINENAHSFKKKLEYSWELFKVNTKFGKFLKNVILQ